MSSILKDDILTALAPASSSFQPYVVNNHLVDNHCGSYYYRYYLIFQEIMKHSEHFCRTLQIFPARDTAAIATYHTGIAT